MEELKRFLNSIDLDYNTIIDKVVLKKDLNMYYVYLKSKNVLSYELVTNLFYAGKKGINGKDKCYIYVNYDNIEKEDILNYVKCIIEDLVFEHPSLQGVINNFNINNNIINIEVSSDNNKKTINNYIKNILNSLKDYGIGNFEINVVLLLLNLFLFCLI